MEQSMQQERVGGFRDFIADVKSGRFPGPEHIVKAPDGLIDQFLDAVDSGLDEQPPNSKKLGQ
jgi:3-methyl-2-oxobutanoate hydroxymethyltransferase